MFTFYKRSQRVEKNGAKQLKANGPNKRRLVKNVLVLREPIVKPY